MFGGAFGYAAHYFFPSIVEHPGNFAIVGMVAFFAAAAKAPISTIIMISEMTGGYGLLAPAMFAVVTAFILAGKKTIFPAQVASRLDSPFHADEFEPIALRRVKVRDVMIQLPIWVNADASVTAAIGLMGDYGLASLPVVAQNRLIGRITLLASHRSPENQSENTRVREIMTPQSPVAYPDEDLFGILKRCAANDVGNLPVVSRERPDCPIGLITRSGLWQAIESARMHRAAPMSEQDLAKS
jgi:CIC family chloride channel protein